MILCCLGIYYFVHWEGVLWSLRGTVRSEVCRTSNASFSACFVKHQVLQLYIIPSLSPISMITTIFLKQIFISAPWEREETNGFPDYFGKYRKLQNLRSKQRIFTKMALNHRTNLQKPSDHFPRWIPSKAATNSRNRARRGAKR